MPEKPEYELVQGLIFMHAVPKEEHLRDYDEELTDQLHAYLLTQPLPPGEGQRAFTPPYLDGQDAYAEDFIDQFESNQLRADQQYVLLKELHGDSEATADDADQLTDADNPSEPADFKWQLWLSAEGVRNAGVASEIFYEYAKQRGGLVSADQVEINPPIPFAWATHHAGDTGYDIEWEMEWMKLDGTAEATHVIEDEKSIRFTEQLYDPLPLSKIDYLNALKHLERRQALAILEGRRRLRQWWQQQDKIYQHD